jgi:uncharacterized phage protein gp47/JayE
MRLPEIRRAIFNDHAARTGIRLDETPDSFTGQHIAVFAEREAALWELLEQVYLSAYPATATGVSLDLAVSFAGVRRLQPARSRANVYLSGSPGTVIPQGSLIESTIIPESENVAPRFYVETVTTIDKASVVEAMLLISNPIVAGTQYYVTINNQQYSYTALPGQVPSQIVGALRGFIPNISVGSGGNLFISQQVPFSISWSPSITVSYLTVAADVVSEGFGAIEAAPGAISRIINSVQGWAAARNPFAAVPGQTIETDDDLRARYSLGVYRLGAGTVPSIYANLTQDIPGVVSVRVFENTTLTTDADGRPGKSVEVVIEGGDNQVIFNRIHALKPAGIQSYGNTTGFVRDRDGYQHPVAFSRPEIRWVWLRMTLATTQEESVPGDVAGRATTAAVAAGNLLETGQDVFLQRIASAPFLATTGLARVTITAAVTAPNAPAPALTAYVSTDLPMGPRQKANFDISRVTVV